MKSAEPIVYIIDDDAAIRESLVLLMETEKLRARAFDSPRDFLALDFRCQSGGPVSACVVSDLRMPGMNGLELMATMKAKGARLPVVMITAYADVALAVKAMKMGAADFIEKPYRDEALVASVRAALAGEGEDAGRAALEEDFVQRLAGLNGREKEVLSGLLEGKLNKIIAHEMGVSIRTVEGIRANVMAKTGAASLSELVRLSLLALR